MRVHVRACVRVCAAAVCRRAGVFPMLKLFQAGGAKNVAFGVMYIINVAAWGLVAAACWVVLGLAVAAYRRGDGPRKDAEYAAGGGVQMA